MRSRVRTRARRAAESEETQQARLQQSRSYQTRQISVKSSEEREASIALLRRNQQQRIVTESAKEREGPLQLLYAGIMCYLRMRQNNALIHAARMARADTVIVCSLPLAKNAIRSPTITIVSIKSTEVLHPAAWRLLFLPPKNIITHKYIRGQ